MAAGGLAADRVQHDPFFKVCTSTTPRGVHSPLIHSFGPGRLDKGHRPRGPAQGLSETGESLCALWAGILARRRRILVQVDPRTRGEEAHSFLLASRERTGADGLGTVLQLTAKALPRLDEDTRLIPILSHLSMGFMAGITSDYTFTTNADGEAITAEMVPELAVQSFPLCMRQLQDTLKSSKHLKHEGRQQYGLFLKVRS